MGYGLYPGTSILVIGIIACIISWITSFIFTILRSVTKEEIDTQKLASGDADYEAYPGDVANHCFSSEDINGHLYFFPESLVFHSLPNKDKLQVKDWILPYDDITGVKHGPAINKILIESKSGATDVFAIHNRERWITRIKSKMKDSPESSANPASTPLPKSNTPAEG
ncbi:MAG: hypothetical protein J5966_01010 [Lachnospiraceae bacterium]|nr:hypothetical protein [Lachnospiraceae bacterium]